MSAHHRGFSLIEVMIVIAIVALLASVAIPLYRRYQARTAEAACLAEMRTYSTWVVAAVANDTDLPLPPQRACAASDTATADSLTIQGTPRDPGTRITTCDMGRASCALAP